MECVDGGVVGDVVGEVCVRAARREDEAGRAALLAACQRDAFARTFLYFFFQELTLQGAVLCGAVCFIFCGCGAATSAALVAAAAAALVALAVRLALAAHAQQLHALVRSEDAGWVATTARGGGGGGVVVGTVSVVAGRVCGAGVAATWRRRGAGAALLATAVEHARRAALPPASLTARVSDLQPEARRLLLAHGWEVRGTYSKPLLGGALSLPVAALALDLPATA